LIEGGGEEFVKVTSCVGSEGEGEFDVGSGGVLAGGSEVTDELMNLLEGEVSLS